MFALRSRDSLFILPHRSNIVKHFFNFFVLPFFMLHPFGYRIKKPATSYFPRQLPTKYHRR